MFDSIKGKIHSVQEGLSASFRGLSVGEGSRRSQRTKSDDGCDPNAGAEILHNYQTQWSELHQLAEENAKKADEADQLIGQMHENFETQWSNVAQISSGLANLPQLLCIVHDLMEQLGLLQGLFEDVEGALLNLEDTIEMQAFQEKQLEHRFQLALHKEKRLADLENLKEQLAEEHSVRIQEFEQKQKVMQKERQEAFSDAFEEDMKQFKIHGKIHKVEGEKEPKAASTSLEEVTLEDDPSALDEFLSDTSSTKG